MSFKKVAEISDEELANQSDNWKNEKLLDACRDGDITAVKRLVSAKANVNCKDIFGKHLKTAVESSTADIVQIFINAGTHVTEEHLMTPVIYKRPDIVQTLISGGAKVTETHLDAALKYSTSDIVQILINTGVKVTEAHLLTAVEYKRYYTVQLLINAGAKVTVGMVRRSEQVISRIITGDFYYYDHERIAKAYKMYEVLTRKTTQETLAKMERDKTEMHQKKTTAYIHKHVTKKELLEDYNKAMKYYKRNMQYQIADFFKYWSKMLRYYLPTRGKTQIIAVFTHKDLVDDQNLILDKIHEIQTIIKEMGMSGMFYEDVFCVNANDPLDVELQQLRDVILGLSKQLDYWGQRMPSKWLLLEDKLMTKKTEGIRVMTLSEVEKLNEESSPKLESRNELFLFLKVHHEVGTLIHFADEGLQNVVILDAQWLVDSFTTIISAKQFKDPKYEEQWNRLHEKGIVDKEFIYRVWEHNQQDRFYEFREELVRLMNSMDLFCSPRKYDNEGQYIVTPYFMVPSMLHKAPVGFIERYQREATHINHALVFEFDFDFLPSATVYRLLATCIMQYGDTDHRRVLVYCDAAVFRVYESHFLTMEITNSSIIANMLVINESQVNVGVSQGVREFLEDSLRYITTAQRTTANYELSVACVKGRHPTSCRNWSKFLELPRERNDSDSTFSGNVSSILKEWVVIKELEEEDAKINKNNQLNVPDDKPTPYSLGRISRRISPKGFRNLFLCLGLEEHVIDEKECQSPKSYKKVVLLLFIEWSKNANSTFKMLANALFECSQYILNLEEIHFISKKWRNDIPSKALAGTLLKATDAQLDQICTMTGSKYLELGLELGLKVEEIEIFEEDLKYCQLITRKVLDTWIKVQRSNATLLVLGDALYEIGCDVQFISKLIM